MREKLKKSTSLLIILCLVLSVFGGSAYAAHRYFEDAKGHWAEDAIRTLTEQGVIAGFPDGLCHPDEIITRAEFATLLARTMTDTVKSDARIRANISLNAPLPMTVAEPIPMNRQQRSILCQPLPTPSQSLCIPIPR